MVYYKKGYKYQLYKEYSLNVGIRPDEHIITDYLRLTKEGLLIIKKGYCWDGCSGPTVDTRRNQRAGLVHDALYELMRMGLFPQAYRKIADKIFRDILKEDGHWAVTAYYLAVKVFASSSAHPKNRRKVYCAPKEK